MYPTLSVVIYLACGVVVFGLLLYSLLRAAKEADRESAEWMAEHHDELRRRRLGFNEREAQAALRPRTGLLTVAPTNRAGATPIARPRAQGE